MLQLRENIMERMNKAKLINKDGRNRAATENVYNTKKRKRGKN